MIGSPRNPTISGRKYAGRMYFRNGYNFDGNTLTKYSLAMCGPPTILVDREFESMLRRLDTYSTTYLSSTDI